MEEKNESHTKEEYLRENLPKNKNSLLTTPILAVMALVVALLIFNQVQINSLSGMVSGGSGFRGTSSGDLANIDLTKLKSTAQTVAAVFPVKNIKTQDDAMAMMFPTGTPDYGEALGVSYDDPVKSLSTLSRMYPSLKAEVEKNKPEAWQKFMTMASMPLGISCEFCCGLGTVGIDKKGNSACGCQHNPALLSVALYLTAYTDYNEGEILKEVMKWKTLFFPKDMIKLGMDVAGGDASKLELPGMVGGC